MSSLPAHRSPSQSETDPVSVHSSNALSLSGSGRAGGGMGYSGNPFAHQEFAQDELSATAPFGSIEVEDPFSDDAEYEDIDDQNEAKETTESPHKQAARTERPTKSRADHKKARGVLTSLSRVLTRPASPRRSAARAATGSLSSYIQTAYSALPSEEAEASQVDKAGWSKAVPCVSVILTISKNWNTKISYYDARGSWSAKFALDGTMALNMADQTDTVRPGKDFRPKHTGNGPLQIVVAEGLPVFSLDSTGPVTSIEKLPNGMFLLEQSRVPQAFILNADNAAVCLSLNREPIYCPRWVTSPNLDYQRVADEYETRNLATTSALSDV